jgi:hypothetical protein
MGIVPDIDDGRGKGGGMTRAEMIELARERAHWWGFAQQVAEEVGLLSEIADCAWWRAQWEELQECLESLERLMAVSH